MYKRQVSNNAFADSANEFVFYNGNVFTANSKNEIQSAIVVKNGKIEFVGDDKKALKIASKNAKKINLSGNTLMPGIIAVSYTHLDVYKRQAIANNLIAACIG